ncbi:MAG: hypothetical protein ACRC5C_08540, partial [Bacilli bacterium]
GEWDEPIQSMLAIDFLGFISDLFQQRPSTEESQEMLEAFSKALHMRDELRGPLEKEDAEIAPTEMITALTRENERLKEKIRSIQKSNEQKVKIEQKKRNVQIQLDAERKQRNRLEQTLREKDGALDERNREIFLLKQHIHALEKSKLDLEKQNEVNVADAEIAQRTLKEQHIQILDLEEQVFQYKHLEAQYKAHFQHLYAQLQQKKEETLQ